MAERHLECEVRPHAWAQRYPGGAVSHREAAAMVSAQGLWMMRGARTDPESGLSA